MKILVPTDLSKNANSALTYANSLGKAMKSKLLTLNVYTPSAGRYSPISGIIAEETARALHDNEVVLNKTCKKYVTIPNKVLLKRGDTIDEIISSASENKADIIVMGTHGASGIAKALFGSNTAKVIGNSTVPVLAIPLKYKYKKVKTIVYASDLSNLGPELKRIIPIAKQLNATIEIFNLYYSDETTDAKKKEVQKKIKSISYKKIKIIEQKADASETLMEKINKYLKKRKPEMLVMFPEERSWFDKIFVSSKTQELSYHLKLPLLSIKK
jgi:nucleotide-binding universal stress UspA family protein